VASRDEEAAGVCPPAALSGVRMKTISLTPGANGMDTEATFPLRSRANEALSFSPVSSFLRSKTSKW
jgi:hypothetical protein